MASQRSNQSWSPDWLAAAISEHEKKWIGGLGRWAENSLAVRIALVSFMVACGLYLIRGWPQIRVELGFAYFRSFGPAVRVAYLLTGALGLFLAMGGLKILLPRWLTGWPFTLLTFVLAGVVLWHHAIRYSLLPSPWMAFLIQAVVTILPFALFLFWLKQKPEQVFGFFAVVLALTVVAYFSVESINSNPQRFLVRNPWALALGLTLTWTVFVGFFWTFLKKSHLMVMTLTGILSLGSTWILWHMGNVAFSRFSNGYLSPSRYWLVFVLLALTLQLSSARMKLSEILKQVFFPSHWLGQVPFFADQLKEQEARVSVYLLGVWDCVKVVGILATLRACELSFPLKEVPIPFFGLMGYFQLFLLSWLVFLMPVGCARMMGYNVPSPFIMPLLAANPLDRWRRWNTYYYEWFRTVVFGPILKKTRSLELAVAATFFVTWYIHAASISAGYHPAHLREVVQILFDKFLFFGMHGLAVYIGIKWPKLFPAGETRWGWLGVLWVTLIMVFIHHFAFTNLIWERIGFLQQYRDLLIGF